MVQAALRNPFAVIVMALVIVIIGITVLNRMPVDILPSFQTPAVQVLTFYPGMPAEIMERDLTNRLERWTGQADGIARQESKSIVGVSIVKDFFRSDIDPNTAMSQVTSLAMSDLFYLPPGTIPPMVMLFDPTASIPLALLTVSSDSLDETKLYDVAYFNIRNQLSSVPGVIAPAVYGGKLRRILVYLDPDKVQARGLSPLDVVNAIRSFNVLVPTGDAKIGDLDYNINANGMVEKVADFNNIPIKMTNGAPVFVKDVGHVQDAYAIQTNIVHVNGKRQVYIPIYRRPGANTIQAVEGVKEIIPTVLARVPNGINLNVIFDQSTYVRNSISALEHEGLLGAALAGLMILIFLGSVRSTGIIILALPLSILAAFIGLYFTGQTINSMTLGGLALAVGMLIDNGIVVLENIDRHLKLGEVPKDAALNAAKEVALPVLVSTITIIVVFFPVIFLTGMGKFLFTPLALAVAFAMAASYIMAQTLVPVAAAKFLKFHTETPAGKLSRTLARFEGSFEHLRSRYENILTKALARRKKVIVGIVVLFLLSLGLYTFIGTELFPGVDAGQFMIRARTNSGTRVERTAELVNKTERFIRTKIPAAEIHTIVSNIGVLNDWPAAYTPNSGPQDAFINVQLTENHSRSTMEYAAMLRDALAEEFPGVGFAFDTGGLITAALNFGLPSPIDIQIEGNDLQVAHGIAERVRDIMKNTPGAVDVRIHQRLDYPQIDLDVDRTKVAAVGLTQEHVVKNVVTALNSSINFLPSFWIDYKTGNHYFVGATYQEKLIDSKETLMNIPITSPNQSQPVLLRNVSTFKRTTAPMEINHLNITRVTDVYANVDGRDIGSAANEIQTKIDKLSQDKSIVPPGYFIRMRGEISSMNESFKGLGFGLILAVILVYLVMVPLFKSFLDPFIIMFSVPLGIMGVLWMLFVTGTNINIQSLMGVIMMVGISVSYSVLLVDFANKLRSEGMSVRDAILKAATIRLRPILMTSLAAILGLLPMAIRLGAGGEANLPLARAVIGGLLVSTVLTLILVPLLYSVLKKDSVQGSVAS
ncbi:MAG: efflux RND transporter permease subunit [Ignavibacteriae bacterium]|nr:efflux RND transporter permease subunit [Ignavibacteriota bacterium]